MPAILLGRKFEYNGKFKSQLLSKEFRWYRREPSNAPHRPQGGVVEQIRPGGPGDAALAQGPVPTQRAADNYSTFYPPSSGHDRVLLVALDQAPAVLQVAGADAGGVGAFPGAPC